VTGLGKASQKGLAPRLLARSPVWRSRGDIDWCPARLVRPRLSNQLAACGSGWPTLSIGSTRLSTRPRPISGALLVLSRSCVSPPRVSPQHILPVCIGAPCNDRKAPCCTNHHASNYFIDPREFQYTPHPDSRSTMLMIEKLVFLLPEVVARLVPVPILAGILALGVVATGVVTGRAATKPRPNYGPGPEGIPFVGNALELPTENDFLVYTSWAKKWGA
jgi:hypothetical protein